MLSNQRLVTNVATCFGLGNLSSFPGTLGSLAAFLFLPLFFWDFVVFAFLFTLPITFFLCAKVCTYYELAHNKKDAKEVIIDELLAQLLLFALIKVCILPKYNILLIYLLGFFMFRFFDISKLWPISLIDKKVGYGLGVMLDDFAAALFSFVILFYLANINLI